MSIDYFCFEGDQYVSWNGYDSLPKLNLANPDVCAHYCISDVISSRAF